MSSIQNSVNSLPRWRGFNVIELFSTWEGWKKYFPYASWAALPEEDFALISELGFNFVRVPMSYLFWTGRDGKIDESFFEQIDHAVDWGEKYNLHVSLNLHRVHGYCINDDLPTDGVNLWKDKDAMEEFAAQWARFAKRYKGVSPQRLSFDLLNEPPYEEAGVVCMQDYEELIRKAYQTISEIDGERLVIADGMYAGERPCFGLADLPVGQSCRGYAPRAVTHYLAEWSGSPSQTPIWPDVKEGNDVWNKEKLREYYKPWKQLIDSGVGVRCGEAGTFCKTPYPVFYSWLEDLLEVLSEYDIGYALWNFRGPFGIIDSGRTDAVYKEWRGHQLDTRMLELLNRY